MNVALVAAVIVVLVLAALALAAVLVAVPTRRDPGSVPDPTPLDLPGDDRP